MMVWVPKQHVEKQLKKGVGRRAISPEMITSQVGTLHLFSEGEFKLTRLMRLSMLALLFALSFSFAPAVGQPAEAATYKWVYIVMPRWQGNCAAGGNVTAIQASVGGIWSTNWDYGDDIVYGKVRIGANQQLSYNLYCNRGWMRGGYYQAWAVNIRPPSWARTIFVGPWGVYYQ